LLLSLLLSHSSWSPSHSLGFIVPHSPVLSGAFPACPPHCRAQVPLIVNTLPLWSISECCPSSHRRIRAAKCRFSIHPFVHPLVHTSISPFISAVAAAPSFSEVYDCPPKPGLVRLSFMPLTWATCDSHHEQNI
jgi:hypothetical protein